MTDTAAPPVAVVLAGGAGRRFGGDKTAAALGRTTVTGALFAALRAQGLRVVLVGPEAGGGPAGALAAAMAREPLEPHDLPDDAVLVVLAGDQPFAGTAAPRLVAALREAPDVDAVLGTDPDGRPQYLLGAYRAGSLRRALGADAADRSMRSVAAALRVAGLPVTATEALDVDTPADLARARELAGEPGAGELGSGA